MAKAQALPGAPNTRRFCKCPTTVKAGDFVLFGDMAANALDDYQSNELGTTFEFSGTYQGTVVAKSSLSPSTGKAVSFGDKLYADGGTLDSATNCTTGFTIDANSSTGTFIGWYDPQENSAAITSTSTNTTAQICLKGNA